ncbi:hypothetical protein ACLKA6_006965 [Drosophila palustris]
MDSGPLLIALAIICFALFILRTMMIAYRFYMLRQLKEVAHIEQAANVTATTQASILLSSIYTHINNTSTTQAYYDYGGSYNASIYYPDPEPDYVYFYSGYAFYIVIFICFVVIMPFAVIMVI